MRRLEHVTLACALVLHASFAVVGEARAQQVLVLANERTLVGRIDELPDGYRVTGSAGATIIPKANVAKVCNDAHEAHAYLQARANLNDPEERLRLARWCQTLGLMEEARSEVQAALALRPRYEEATRLLAVLQKTSVRMPADGQSVPPTPEQPRQTRAGDASSQQTPEYSPEVLRGFTQRIQPLLFNGCGTAACHGSPGRGEFELRRGGAGAIPATLTRQNLLATLKLVDRADPAHSPLVRLGLEAHGGAKRPPLGGPGSPAHVTLLNWLKQVVPAAEEREGSKRTSGSSPASALESPDGGNPESKPARRESGFATLEDRSVESPAAGSSKDATESATTARPSKEQTAKAPAQAPVAADPFDPAIFNWHNHPKRR